MLTIRNARVRRVLAVVIPAVAIPAVLLVSALLWRERYYNVVSLLIVLLALALFLTGFERRQTGARRLILVCVLTVLAVAGRVLPLLKPVAAITMLAGIYLGAQAGFLTGASAALLSNFLFGQGPWTPFQMFAWGMIGLLAGCLARPLRASRPLLLVCGAIAGIFFSLLMDVWSVLWFGGTFAWPVYAAALVTALPHTLLYMAGNVLFLWLLAEPVGRKLTRICRKYDI